MAINPYTLAHLCDKGILNSADIAMLNAPTFPLPTGNQYMNMAAQGNLYQNYGLSGDTFHSSYTPAYTPAYPQGISSCGYNGMPAVTGSLSNAGGFNAFNGYGVGIYNNNNLLKGFGVDGVTGSKCVNGGLNAFGGFNDTQNNISSGFNKTLSVIERVPKEFLGLLAGAIGITGIVLAVKSGKKPKVLSTGNSNFFSKIKFWKNK